MFLHLLARVFAGSRQDRQGDMDSFMLTTLQSGATPDGIARSISRMPRRLARKGLLHAFRTLGEPSFGHISAVYDQLRFDADALRDIRSFSWIRRAEAALERVGAPRTLHTPLQSISGGELQRVLLARALLRDPELLVLDEPSQGVDLAGQEELFALITGIRDERGCGVLMVSHDLHLVMGSTDRVVCLNRTVCCTGAPLAVSSDPAYLRLFPANLPGFALYTHRHGGDASCGAEDRHDG